MDNKPMPIKTAKWPTAIVILLATFVIFSENKIVQIADHSELIPLYAPQSENEVVEIDDGINKLIDEKVKMIVDILFEKYSNVDFTTKDINQAFNNQHLQPSEFKMAISHLGNKFYQAKLFAKTEKVLSNLNLNDRIQLGSQFKWANSLSKLSKNSSAINSYKALISKRPNHQAATINLGILLNETEQYDEAIKIFSRAIEITSSVRKAKSYAGLGSALFKLKQYDKAVVAFNKSIEYRPKFAGTWRKLAKAMNFSQTDPKQVDLTYQKSLSLSKKNYRLHNEYGLFLLSKLNFKDSTEQFKIAKKLLKNSAEIRFNLALSYLERGRYKDARKYLYWINRKKKQFPHLELSKALYSFAKKEFETATQQLEILRKKQPNNLIVEYYLGRIFSLQNQPNAAINKYQLIKTDLQWQHLAELRHSRDLMAQKKYPQSLLLVNKLLAETLNLETLLYQKSNLLMLTGKKQQALAAISLAYQAASSSRKMTLKYASLLHINGKTQKSISILLEYLENNKRFIRGRELLAEIYLDIGKVDLAIKQFQIAISNESSDINLRFKLAKVLFDNKQYEQANNVLDELLLQQSKNIDARILLAKSKLLNLEYNRSLYEINLALKLEPENIEALNLKSTILEKQ